MSMTETPAELPAGVRLRCLQCGSQWEHGSWVAAEEGSMHPVAHACPMCAMPLSYITNGSLKARTFYELSSTKTHYDV